MKKQENLEKKSNKIVKSNLISTLSNKESETNFLRKSTRERNKIMVSFNNFYINVKTNTTYNSPNNTFGMKETKVNKESSYTKKNLSKKSKIEEIKSKIMNNVTKTSNFKSKK